MTTLRRLLVANRGEIAIRIARTARRLGIETVAVVSDADVDAPHARPATGGCDRAVVIGGERAADSYLRIDRLLDAARVSGADAVHPGYGFLAERADFADAVIGAGLVWVGPPPAAMRAMADKAAARRHAASLGIAVLEGWDAAQADLDTVRREALRIGFPLMVKAAAGGGGRGMRLVGDAASLPAALESAAAEALAAFGDARLLLERAVVDARHVEVQVFADRQGTTIHLGERDCSVQRRHQKLIEEAPSPAVPPALRRRMGDAAVTLARSAGYVGAGTVEFLLDTAGEFWFIEINTRLQVEHAVTEALVGIDLVEWQLRIAEGSALPLAQGEALARFEAGGHAIEARLCAEDVAAGFLPQSGRLARWAAPAGVRVDHALASGAAVPPFYDSMLAKVVAHATDRTGAVARLASALDATVCLGVTTNRAFLAQALRDPVFAAGDATTSFVGARFENGAPIEAADRETDAVSASALAALAATASALLPRQSLPAEWAGWSTQPAVERSVPLRVGSATQLWRLGGHRDAIVATRHATGGGDDAARHRIDALRSRHVEADGGEVEATVDGRQLRATFARDGATTWWLCDGREFATTDASLLPAATAQRAAAGNSVVAPMHGRVVQVLVEAGAAVDAGAPLLVIEAMKMEHAVRAPRAGIVATVQARVGDQVALRQTLLELV